MTSPGATGFTGSSARTLTRAAMATLAVEAAIWFWLGVYLDPRDPVPPVALALGAFSMLGLVLVYLLAYRPMARGDFAGARTPTIVFAGLSLLLANPLSALLLALAHHELGSPELDPRPRPPSFPPTPLAPTVGICPICTRPNPPSTPFCRSCGYALH